MGLLQYSKTWQEKQSEFLDAVRMDDAMGRSHIDKIFFTSMITAFYNEWDVMPNGRKKTMRPQGAICPIKIKIHGRSPYTGLLKVDKAVCQIGSRCFSQCQFL